MSKLYVSEYKTISKWQADRGECGGLWTQQVFRSKKERDFFFEDNFYSFEWYTSLLTKYRDVLKLDNLKLLVARKDYVWNKKFDSKNWKKGMKNTITRLQENEKFLVKSPSECASYTYNNPKEAWDRMKKILPNQSTIYSVARD